MVHGFCPSLRRTIGVTRGRLRRIGVRSRMASMVYRRYNHGVIVGCNPRNGFLTYPKFPRYEGAGPCLRGVKIPYPIYKGRIIVHGAGGKEGCCKYRSGPRYRFVS